MQALLRVVAMRWAFVETAAQMVTHASSEWCGSVCVTRGTWRKSGQEEKSGSTLQRAEGTLVFSVSDHPLLFVVSAGR